MAKPEGAALHMVTVEELPWIPASIDEVEEEKTEANHRLAPMLDASRTQAQAAGVAIETHLVPGHAVQAIVALVKDRLYVTVTIQTLFEASTVRRLAAVVMAQHRRMHRKARFLERRAEPVERPRPAEGAVDHHDGRELGFARHQLDAKARSRNGSITLA